MANNKNISSLNLMSPPAAQTESSIALIWDKKLDLGEITSYQICSDGKPIGSTTATDYTVTGLEPNHTYCFTVYPVSSSGSIPVKDNSVTIATKPQSEILNILSFGAVGDGKTLNTKFIQDAIDSCSDGGTVYIPSGKFITGALYLKSNMTLHLDDGAVLFGSGDIKDYPLCKYRFEGLETLCYSSLINTKTTNKRLENITISGNGTIDANGSVLRKREVTENRGKPGRAICLRNTDNVYLKDITVRQSPAWCVHLIYCNNISVNNVKIHTKYDENGNQYSGIMNGDGLDPDSSSNVYIFNSMIASQDDCIAIKSGRNEEGRKVGISSENIRITNCCFRSGFGVAVGSEMSGDVRNVLVQDCDFKNTFSIGSVKSPRGRGGIIENIIYDNVCLENRGTGLSDCEWFRGGLYVDQFYSHVNFDPNALEEFNEGTSIIRNITFKNVSLDTDGGNAIYLAGLPESPLYNIHLENITASGKYGMKANNIRGLIMNNVSVVSMEDEPYSFNKVELKQQ